MVAIPISIAEAEVTTQKQQNNENITVELGNIETDGTITAEKTILSTSQLLNLEKTLTNIIGNIQSIEDLDILESLTGKIFGSSILGKVSQSLFKIKLKNSRAFVISSGHNYGFNLFKKNDLKIRKTFTFWHYTSDGFLKDRTIILQPLALSMRILKGRQFGFMTGFTGIYLHIPRSLPEKSYTFFIGTARNIKGMDFSLPPILNNILN